MSQRSAARVPSPSRAPYWMRASRGRHRPRLEIVREDEASPAIRECFDEITATLGFPVVNVIFRAFARYPRFLALSWDLLKPNVLTQDLFDKTQVLRRHAQQTVRERLGVADLRAVLRLRGSSDDAIGRVRTVLDFVLYCDPFLLLIASALQSSLSGHPLPGKPWAHLLPLHTNPTRFQELPLVEIEEAPPAVREAYGEIMRAHETSFVPTDYRALGRFPECLGVAWAECRQRMQSPAWGAGVRELNELALALAQDLPFGFALSPQTLERAGFTPLQVSDILATVDFFQGLLPALIVNITVFRIGLEGGCRPAAIA